MNFAFNVSVFAANSSVREVFSLYPVAELPRFLRKPSRSPVKLFIAFPPISLKTLVAIVLDSNLPSTCDNFSRTSMNVSIGMSSKLCLNSSAGTPIKCDSSSRFWPIIENARLSRVPAFDASTPIEIIEAPNANVSVSANPNCFPVGPSDIAKAMICCSEAAVVFPRTFIAEPRFDACSMGISYILANFAIEIATSEPAISKEVAIFAAVSVKARIFSFPTIPNCPATAAIFASSSWATGMCNAISSIALPSSSIWSLDIPVVFRTFASASSNAANDLTAAAPNPTIAAVAKTATPAMPKGPKAVTSFPAAGLTLLIEF